MNGNIESAKQICIITIVYFTLEIGVGMFSILVWGQTFKIFKSFDYIRKFKILYDGI